MKKIFLRTSAIFQPLMRGTAKQHGFLHIGANLEVSRPQPLKRHVLSSQQFRLSAHLRSGAAALAPHTLFTPFLDPNAAISDS